MAIVATVCALTFNSIVTAQGGWAFYGGSVTGGAGGSTITVISLAELTAAIADDVPRIVNVSGTINLGNSNARFGSNKTIQGVGTNSGFIGNLKGVSVNNVIIQRLNFTNPNVVGDGDGLSLEGCTRIWIDHCSFVDCGDGSLDIKRGSDYITVSWCKFSYTFNSGHNFANLIGHSDSNASQDAGKLRITFHHNWWSTGTVERMPRVRFGRVHSYNNYFNAPGNNYCIRASIQSEVLTEYNSFENINSPQEKYSPAGLIRSRNNQYVNCTNVVEFSDNVFTPPYAYSPDPVANVKSAVMAGAGSGGTGGGGTQPPAAPSNLAATSVSSSQINLTWSDNANNETGFTIDRATNSSFSSGLVTSYVGSNTTSFQATGLSASTTYYFRARSNNSAGSSANSNTASATTSGGGGGGSGTTVTFVSIGSEDGRIVESSESSNTGGSVDTNASSSSALRAGDDSSDRQIKTILSFDTSSIPDGATIVSATLRLTRGSVSGTSPFTTHGTCFVDIKGGSGFSNSVALQTGDFQAAADATQVASLSAAASNGAVSSGTLNATGRGFINKTGKTQFRVYFATDDNDDGGNDYIGWYSGNDSSVANRPVLEVVYQ